jgi:hypothetical protein
VFAAEVARRHADKPAEPLRDVRREELFERDRGRRRVAAEDGSTLLATT